MSATLTERGRRTRQRIVEETGRQILAGGIGGTSLDTVRAATLTSKSQLFHYFPGGKAELVREVAAWEAEQLMQAQDPEVHDLGSWASWERWRDALVHYYFDLGRWACPIGSLATQASFTDPELARGITEAMTGWRDLLAAGVARMQAAGEIDPATDPVRLAAALLAAIQGGLVLSQSEGSGWPLEAALEHAFAALRATGTARSGG